MENNAQKLQRLTSGRSTARLPGTMPGCVDDQVRIPRGHNAWVLARTDRDAPTRDDVLETAGAFLSRVLGDASPSGQRNIFEHVAVPGTEGARFVIGAARPVEVQAIQPETTSEALDFSRPKGKLLGRHSDCPVLRTVKAERPWLVTVEFDWRGPSTKTDWPRRRVNALGFPTDDDHELDWLLLAAAHQGEAQQDDTTLLDEVSEDTKRKLKKVADQARAPLMAATAVVVVGGLAYLAWRFAPRRSRA